MAGEPEGTDDPQQAHRHGPVIDELLCFVTNKLSLLPPETIFQLCVSTYNASEIECSKKLICRSGYADTECEAQRRKKEP